MDRARIQELIPHRAPFLFVDRVVERSADSIVTEWRVPEDAFFLRGHYPGFPLVPGVILCEAAVQSGALWVALDARERAAAPASGAAPVLVKLGEARFRRMVRPGETVAFHVVLDEHVGPAWTLTARAVSAGRKVARVSFTVALAAVDAGEPA